MRADRQPGLGVDRRGADRRLMAGDPDGDALRLAGQHKISVLYFDGYVQATYPGGSATATFTSERWVMAATREAIERAVVQIRAKAPQVAPDLRFS